MLNKKYLILVLAALPVVASAQLTKVTGMLATIKAIVSDILIPLAFTLAVLFFFWGIVKFIWSVSESGKTEGKKIMTWGIVALFVMSCIWGIIYFIGQEIGGGVGDVYEMRIPTIKP